MVMLYSYFILLCILIYGFSFFVCFSLLKKYNAPGALALLGLCNLYGVIIMLILVFRPNGYADKAKRVQCPTCGGLIGPEFKICPYCGNSTTHTPGPATDRTIRVEAYQRRCTQCGEVNSADARFCKQCGTKMN